MVRLCCFQNVRILYLVLHFEGFLRNSFCHRMTSPFALSRPEQAIDTEPGKPMDGYDFYLKFLAE